jgi:zinc transporter 1/2/3
MVTFSSSPDEHDSDSVVSDTYLKEEHNAFMDPCHAEFDYPTALMQHSSCRDLEYELEMQMPNTLRCNHTAAASLSRQHSHSLAELGVTKVVKQLSQADLTRRAHFRSIIYIMALSLHGIFEGLALGLQSTETSVWLLCFALCLHRCVLAFQLGMDLCGARESQGTAFLCIGRLCI